MVPALQIARSRRNGGDAILAANALYRKL